MALESLFQPIKFKRLQLPNRVLMAPMTRAQSPGGVVTPEVAGYYRRRVEGEVGMIISEGSGVARPASLNDPGSPRFFGDRELAGWKTVIDEVHAAGGLMAPQLWHVGAVESQHAGWSPAGLYESPSGYSKPGEPFGMAMSEEDVADTISAFAAAARQAQRLGFDAVELHGAHGYLIDQFFWEGTNFRTDRFGGPLLVDRARFAAEILKAVRGAVGPDFPIIIRLSQWKRHDYEAKLAATPKVMEDWLGLLMDAGADAFHCSQRRFWEAEFEGSDLNFAGWAKKLTGAMTITVGSVGLTGDYLAAFGGESSKPASLDELTRRLERGDFDLVAVGRAILQDPNWVRKVREGQVEALMDFERSAMTWLS
jgi:2,4-dienoyl-CoA reductase-like NADH-dependent reductase (Old Yellow Enzyme family)